MHSLVAYVAVVVLIRDESVVHARVRQETVANSDAFEVDVGEILRFARVCIVRCTMLHVVNDLQRFFPLRRDVKTFFGSESEVCTPFRRSQHLL